MSKGYKWICYDCTKDTDRIREGNMGWEREEDTEENTTKKSGEHVRCSKCNGSSDPLVEPIIIDITPNTNISTPLNPLSPLSPLNPMDTTPRTTGEDKDGGKGRRRNRSRMGRVCWKLSRGGKRIHKIRQISDRCDNKSNNEIYTGMVKKNRWKRGKSNLHGTDNCVNDT